MKPDELKRNLQPLAKYDLFIVFCFVVLRWLRYKLASLRPVHLLIPTSISQIVLFVVATLRSPNPLPALAVGNLILVGVALLPSTLRRPPQVHWIKS